ncbi:MAG: long-chain fatty acid transport protein [Candidatus Krumholzibacteriia bacterium]|jgi:long-chain fatty acid transport protein
MRNRIICTLALAGIALMSAGTAQATGFSIYEAGSRATALGGAFTANADDGSAVYYNAAGLSFIEGQTVDLNVIFIKPDFKFSGKLNKPDAVQTGEADPQTFLVPGAYYTHNNGGKFAFGVGVYAPFGLGVKWKDPETWVGRRINYDVSIETVYVTPAVSFKATENLALAIGLDVAHQNLELNKFTPEPDFGTNAIDTNIEGSSDINITPSLGLMYRPDEKFSFGLMYHFKKTMKFEGAEATLTNVQGPNSWADQLITGLGGPKQELDSELNLPYILSLGIGYQFTEAFRAEANYVRFGWSAFKELTLDFNNDALDQLIEFNYEDSWQVRLGAEYDINEKFTLMGGYVRDTTPQPLEAVSPLLPDSDRNDYSFGLAYHANTFDVTLSYMYVAGEERTNIENGEPVRNDTDYPFGTYAANANLFGVGFSYHF